MGADNAITEQSNEQIEEQAVHALEFIQYFDQLDTASPFLRYIIAGSIISVALVLLLFMRVTTRRRINKLEARDPEAFKPLRFQNQDLVTSADMQIIRLSVWRWVGRIGSALCLLLAFNGLLFVSKWSLYMAAHLLALIITPLSYIWFAAIDYLPDFLTALIIICAARFLIHIVGLIFDGIKKGRVRLPNFYPEWADPSFGLIKILIIVLTAVIIFPYLPGSSSPAFQGISIFIGLLVSLGSTTAVANVVAGTVLTYTRAFKIGDQVLVSTTRGRIVERTTFVTRVQTPKNVIVSIPNSMVLNNDIINYSKNMGGSGLLVHTSITIGYDVPWPTVQKLLIAAALKTDRIEATPEPFVLQTSLDDNYVSYEINGWTQKPEELPLIYSKLHANILDEFHGHNVEITSPAYRASRDGNASTIPEVR